MDEVLIQYCQNCVDYIINNLDADNEKYIAYAIKQVKQNTLIYINTIQNWYAYNDNTQLWDITNTINIFRLTKFFQLFNVIIPEFISNNPEFMNQYELDTTHQFSLPPQTQSINSNGNNELEITIEKITIIKSKNISQLIMNDEINLELLENYCKQFFSITPDI